MHTDPLCCTNPCAGTRSVVTRFAQIPVLERDQLQPRFAQIPVLELDQLQLRSSMHHIPSPTSQV